MLECIVSTGKRSTVLLGTTLNLHLEKAGRSVGICRFLLAMAVFADHVSTPKGFMHLTGSQTAVEGFFVISGYLMALIQDQHKYRSHWSFWKSRFLRIFPIYWVILGLSILASLFIQEYGRPYLFSTLEFSPINFSLIGLDLIVVLALAGGIGTASNIIVPQSWTLSLEIYFYLLVPSLTKLRTKWLGIICLLILTLKLSLFITVGLNDPWSYRFFPLEIGFFLWGVFMYRLQPRVPRYSEFAVLAIWLFGGLYRWGSPIREWESMIFPLMLGLTLGNFMKWDRIPAVQKLGKLSYPLYLTHALVATLTLIALRRLDLSLGIWWKYALILLFTLTLSMVLLKFIDVPIEKMRKRLASTSVTP